MAAMADSGAEYMDMRAGTTTVEIKATYGFSSARHLSSGGQFLGILSREDDGANRRKV